jgi:hypothetical protein
MAILKASAGRLSNACRGTLRPSPAFTAISQHQHAIEALQAFMSKIIKANNIALPKLPEGQVYKYRPEEHQLWVEAAETKVSTQ